MAKIRAAILAAGRGVRMGGEHPKSLLPLGEHKPLLWHILEGLEAAAIADVMVVTGFKPPEVQKFVDENASENMKVTYVFNARYASWGNFHSVRLALEQSPGRSVLLVNSDVVVNPEVYKRVATLAADLVLAVQKRRRLDAEDMRVQLSGRRVLAIGKALKMARSHGEFAGISLLDPYAARLYMDIASRLEWSGTTGVYYEDVFADMLDRVIGRAALVEDGEYAEVDNPEDVEAAVSVVERFSQPDHV